MHFIEALLMVVAVILLFVEGLSLVDTVGRIKVGWLGLALWATVVAIEVIS